MARRAIGPITAEGKAISAQNAWKHGLDVAPDKNLVVAWFCVILDNSECAIEKPNANDPRREATLMLAISEARYHRALHKAGTDDTVPNSARQVAKFSLKSGLCLMACQGECVTVRQILLTWNLLSLAWSNSRG